MLLHPQESQIHRDIETPQHKSTSESCPGERHSTGDNKRNTDPKESAKHESFVVQPCSFPTMPLVISQRTAGHENKPSYDWQRYAHVSRQARNDSLPPLWISILGRLYPYKTCPRVITSVMKPSFSANRLATSDGRLTSRSSGKGASLCKRMETACSTFRGLS